MKRFTLYDPATGRLIAIVSGANALTPSQPHVVGRPPQDGQRYRVEAGEFVIDATPDPEPDYRERRAESYPTLANQMDSLWHAMDSGVIPMVPAFYDPIKAVKDSIPKP